ncbi:MAG TPA: response regulator transcription factor, partial [Saprospiraceae bacterium]|nr:response regulator transcription factor [Saprospiraceae bacterium]
LISIIENHDIDVVVTEISFIDMDPEELIAKIKKANNAVKILIVSAYREMSLVKTCFRLGVDGYMLKKANMDSFYKGLTDVLRGEIHIGQDIKLSPDINGKKLESRDNFKKKVIFGDRLLLRESLTNREKEILGFIYNGLNNKSISEKLFISEHTVSVHRKHIMKKMNVNTTKDLLDFVEKHDILVQNMQKAWI